MASPDPPAAPHPEPAPAAALVAPAAPLPITTSELVATAALFLLFVANILLAVLFASPSQKAGLQAFADPNDVTNSAVYLVMILVFTFIILWIAKKGAKWLIRLIILTAVASTISYVVYPLLHIVLGWSTTTALIVAVAAALLAAFALYKHPEWYVIDSVGLLVAAGSAAIFGISLGILPVIVLLAALAIYDAIAVYKTKHMLALADSVIELRLPVLLVIPKHTGYHFREEAAKFKEANAENKAEREAMFMGLGDLVMPTILVVSALIFLPALISLPLQASVDSPHHPGVPFNLDVQAADGHPVSATYTISSSPNATTMWSVHSSDGRPSHNGTGIPAVFMASYDHPASFLMNVTVATASGVTMSEVWKVDVGYVGRSDAFTLLLHSPAALGAAIGTLVGFLVLMAFVLRGNPQAGLPLLNGGAITGFLIGVYVATGSIKFW